MQLKSFRDFVFESEESNNISIADMKAMADLGLISKEELRKFKANMGREELLKESPEIREILNSPEVKELYTLHGLSLISSKTQLLNGTLIFARPNYDKTRNYALGFFSSINVVRRMTPKQQQHYYGIYNPLDQKMQSFSQELEPVDFYRTAMRWALDRVDFTQDHFPVIRKSKKG